MEPTIEIALSKLQRPFSEKMTKAGNRCELHALEGAGHVFLFDEKYRKEASKAMKNFLVSSGYLPG